MNKLRPIWILFPVIIMQFFCFSQQAFSKEKWKRVYLASYPRSGNHWMRYLLEEATHIATGSVYRDREPKHLNMPFPWGGYACENGYRGNCRYPLPGEIVVIKTHYPSKNLNRYDLKSSEKTLRIVRHPIDSFSSHFKHHPNLKTEGGKIPSSFVKKSIRRWREFMEYWDKRPNVYTLRYEDLHQYPQQNLRKVLKKIGYAVNEEDINRAIEKNPPQGSLLKHYNEYHSKDIELINKELHDIMQKYNYLPE